MSEKKTRDEEAIIALAHALADQRWIAEDRLDDTKTLQDEIDNLNGINSELNDMILLQKDEIAHLKDELRCFADMEKQWQDASLLAVSLRNELDAAKAEIERLNEDCARRASDLVTFDEMRKEAIAQRDVTQGLLEKRSECLCEIATALGLASTDWSRIMLRINALQVAAKCVTAPGDTLPQFPNPPHPQHEG